MPWAATCAADCDSRIFCLRYSCDTRSVWTLLGGETLEVASFGAKFFALCWAFVALVIIEK